MLLTPASSDTTIKIISISGGDREQHLATISGHQGPVWKTNTVPINLYCENFKGFNCEALEYANKNDLEVCTVSPSWVMGLLLQPFINAVKPSSSCCQGLFLCNGTFAGAS
ncbi:hypothetical protein MRB53_015178 [Persea americana]|uniref:Uncharacterized protein n=1 Tax=Persea americana TaxID=3435 RepID=A0ACC2KDD3_PERAE|nr:hypothetical protein MRB53_015178 [Persea americana]